MELNWLGSDRCISLWRRSILGHLAAVYITISSSLMKLYTLGLVLAYSSICMVSLTISSVVASRLLVYTSTSTSHLEYLNHVLVPFNLHYINMSIKTLIGQGRQAAYVLRLIGSRVTSSKEISNEVYRSITIIVKAAFHEPLVTTNTSSYFLLTYRPIGYTLNYIWASLSTIVGSTDMRLLVL